MISSDKLTAKTTKDSLNEDTICLDIDDESFSDESVEIYAEDQN